MSPSQSMTKEPHIMVVDDYSAATKKTGERITENLEKGTFCAPTSVEELFDICFNPDYEGERPFNNPFHIPEGVDTLTNHGLPYSMYKPSAINLASLLRVLGYKGYIFIVSGDNPKIDKINTAERELLKFLETHGLKAFSQPLINGWMPKMAYMDGSSCAYWNDATQKMVNVTIQGPIEQVVAETLRNGGYPI